MICNNRTFWVHNSVIARKYPNIASGAAKFIRVLFLPLSAEKMQISNKIVLDKVFLSEYNHPNNRKSTQNKPTIKMSSPVSESYREPQAVELRQMRPCEWTYEGGRKPADAG